VTPGWHPDPTARHQYRYWDGQAWTDDVADQGTTSVDPVGAATRGAAPPHAEPTPGDRVRGEPTSTGPEEGASRGGPARAADPAPGTATEGDRPPALGMPAMPAMPARSRRSPSLVLGLAAVAVAVITAVAVVAMGAADDGETGSDDPPGDAVGPDGFDLDDSASRDEVVDALAGQLGQSGAVDRQQAECVAEVLVDEIGEQRLIEILRSGGDVLFSLTGEEQSAIVTAVSDCGVIGLPGAGTTPD
jgi:hypothetical protein